MKVKIKNKIYDAKDHPIMLILTDGEKKNIANMEKKAKKFLVFEDEHFKNEDAAKNFMKTDEDNEEVENAKFNGERK